MKAEMTRYRRRPTRCAKGVVVLTLAITTAGTARFAAVFSSPPAVAAYEETADRILQTGLRQLDATALAMLAYLLAQEGV